MIIGAIIFGSVGVYATYSFASSEVTYTENNQTTVKSALDDLYTRANTWINPASMTNSKSITSNGTYDITNYKNVSVSVANTNTETYNATTRNSKIDMGATNTYRYVNTSSVPNANSATYTPSSNGTALDMGATNTYRYVNTSTVYNLGYNTAKTTRVTGDGVTSVGFSKNTKNTVFANGSGLCIIRNFKISCFRINNYSSEKTHIQTVFSDGSCSSDSESVHCLGSDFDCNLGTGGGIRCKDLSNNSECFVNASSTISCT